MISLSAIVWWLALIGIAFGLYALGIFIKLVGDFYTLLCQLFGRVCIHLYAWCAASPFHYVVAASEGDRPGLAFVAQLFYLLAGIAIVPADGIAGLIGMPAFWGSIATASPQLVAGLVDAAVASLFLLSDILLALTWLEGRGHLPQSARLFEPSTEQDRLWRRLVTIALFVSIASGAGFYLLRAVYLIDTQAWYTVVLRCVVFLLLSLEVFASGAVAGWAMIVGLQGLLVAVVAVCSFGAQVGARTAETLCLHFSSYRQTPFDLPPDPIKQIRGADVPLVQRAVAYGKQAHRQIAAAPADVLPDPHEEDTVDSRKISSMVCVGDLGSEIEEFIVQDCHDLGAASCLLTAGHFNPAIITTADRVVPGTVSISPARAQDHLQAMTNRSSAATHEALLLRLGENLVTEHAQVEARKALPALLVFVIDERLLAPSEKMLRYIKHHLPGARVLLVTSLPAGSGREVASASSSYCAYQTLQAEGVIETVLVVDVISSAFAHSHGRQTLLRHLSRFLVTLLMPELFASPPRSALAILREFAEAAAFCSLALASAPAMPAKLPARLAWINLLPGTAKARQKGTGDITGVVRTTCELVTHVLDPHSGTTPALRVAPSPVLPSFVLCSVPLAHAERDKLRRVSQELARFVGARFPAVLPIVCRVNGTPLSWHLSSPYYVQASYLFGIKAADLVPAGGTQQQTVAPVRQDRLIEVKTAAEQEASETSALVPLPVEPDREQGSGNGAHRGQGEAPGSGESASPRSQVKRRGRPRADG